MKTQKPDEWLKKSLHDLRVPATEDEWKNIASSLDASVPPADQFLKENLSSLEVPASADEWANIAASLDAAVPGSSSFFSSRKIAFALSAVVLIGLLWLLYPLKNVSTQTASEKPAQSGSLATDQKELPASKERVSPNTSSSSAKTGNISEPAAAGKLSASASGSETISENSGLNAEQQEPIKDKQTKEPSENKAPAKNIIKAKSKNLLPAIINSSDKNTSTSKAKKAAVEPKGTEKSEAAATANNSSSTPLESKESVADKSENSETIQQAQKEPEAIMNPATSANEKPAEQATEQKTEALTEQVKSNSEEVANAATPLLDSSAQASKNNMPPAISLPKKSGFLLGFSFSPEWAYRSWEMNKDFEDKTHKEYKDLRNGQEKPRLSFSLSVNAEYRFAKGFMVQSGLIYSQKGFSTRYDYKVTQVPVVDANTGVILGYLSKTDTQGTRYSAGQSYTYMELPLVAGYQFKLNDKISLQLKAGGSLQYLVGTSGKTIDPATLDLVEISGQKSFKQRNFGYMFSAGVSYAILPRMQLIAEPVYRKTAQPVTITGNNYSQSFYSVGMNLGVMYKLF